MSEVQDPAAVTKDQLHQLELIAKHTAAPPASDFYEAHKDKMRERQEAWSSHAAAPRHGLLDVLTTFCDLLKIELAAIQAITFEPDRGREDSWLVTFSSRGSFIQPLLTVVCEPVFRAVGADADIVTKLRIEAHASLTGKTRIVARIWNRPTEHEFTVNQQAE